MFRRELWRKRSALLYTNIFFVTDLIFNSAGRDLLFRATAAFLQTKLSSFMLTNINAYGHLPKVVNLAWPW